MPPRPDLMLYAKISLWSDGEQIGLSLYVGRGFGRSWVTLFVITNMEEWLLLSLLNYTCGSAVRG